MKLCQDFAMEDDQVLPIRVLRDLPKPQSPEKPPMPQYKGLSATQHQEIASEVLAVKEKTRQIFFQLLEAYGVNTKVVKCAQRLINEIDIFKSEMDAAYLNDKGQEAPHILPTRS